MSKPDISVPCNYVRSFVPTATGASSCDRTTAEEAATEVDEPKFMILHSAGSAVFHVFQFPSHFLGQEITWPECYEERPSLIFTTVMHFRFTLFETNSLWRWNDLIVFKPFVFEFWIETSLIAQPFKSIRDLRDEKSYICVSIRWIWSCNHDYQFSTTAVEFVYKAFFINIT